MKKLKTQRALQTHPIRKERGTAGQIYPATALPARKNKRFSLLMFRSACKRTRKGKIMETSQTQTLTGPLTALNYTINKLQL